MAWCGLATALRSRGGYLCLMFFWAGFATGVFAQSDTPASSSSPDQGCVKTRCGTPSCFRKYAGGYFNRCPNGDFPIKNPYGETAPAEPAQATTPPPAPPAPTQPHMWVRPNTATISPGDVAGDWEPADRLKVGRATAILRLRLSSSGSLTGALETPLAIPPQRIKLEDVQINGKSIIYKLPNGNTFRGTFSNDRQMISGDQGSPTWQHVRTLAQALAEDAKEKPSPTDGTWRGAIDHIEWSDIVKPPYPKEGLHMLLRFNSAPRSCAGSVHPSAEFASSDMLPCQMKLDGSHVQVSGRYVGIFSGTLSGNQLTGTWTPADGAYFVAYAKVPMKVTLTRDAAN